MYANNVFIIQKYTNKIKPLNVKANIKKIFLKINIIVIGKPERIK